MTEAEWLACDNPWVMLNAPHDGPGFPQMADARRERLFLCAWCRRIEAVFPTCWDRSELDTAERLADGLVSDQEHHEIRARLSAARQRIIDEPGITAERVALGALHAVLVGSGPYSGNRLASIMVLLNGIRADASAAEFPDGGCGLRCAEEAALVALGRDIFGNPFRPVAFFPEWRTSTAVALAAQVYESREFSAMPILGDALQDAGCDNVDVLDHCRGPGPHVRGCWVVDLVLGKE